MSKKEEPSLERGKFRTKGLAEDDDDVRVFFKEPHNVRGKDRLLCFVSEHTVSPHFPVHMFAGGGRTVLVAPLTCVLLPQRMIAEGIQLQRAQTIMVTGLILTLPCALSTALPLRCGLQRRQVESREAFQ